LVRICALFRIERAIAMRFGAQKESSPKSAQKAPPSLTRQSSGFDQFCATLRNSQNLSILDMSGASQANISFITEMGHRISSDDIVGTMQECFGHNFLEAQQAASVAQRFLDQTLTFPEAFFDGALVWDALQLLSSPLLEETVTKLLRVMRPGGQMLCFFNADEKAKQIPIYSYRIQDQKTLLQIPRTGAGFQRSQFFNNRALEKLFQKAASVKFFLTRDHLREVIVRR
jgi:hypothetical protein